MAGTSARKRQRQNLKRRMRNRAVRSSVRGAQRKFALALRDNNVEEASAEFKRAEKLIDTAARKGVFHKNAAARTKSRMRKKLNAIKEQ